MSPAAIAHVPIYRLVESTAWAVGKSDQFKAYVTLECRHVIETNGPDLLNALQQGDARATVRDNVARVEMRCGRCENVAGGPA